MVKQPENSKLCGQCCLATILNISLEDSIALIGHKHGTRTKELIRHFPTDSDRLSKAGIDFYFALCKVHFEDQKQTHWIVYKDGMVYDPVIGKYIAFERWKTITAQSGARITSGIKITNPANQ
jgi:hypothetical protein